MSIKDLSSMMKQAQSIQTRLAELQSELAEARVDGQAGAGLVTVTLDGKGDMHGIQIDPSLAKPDEVEILEDLLIAAFTDAKAKVEVAMQDKMKELTGGLPLPPGMKLF